MKKIGFILSFVLILLPMSIVNTSVSATSWVELNPEEVLDRAEVIVIGTYDFSSKPKSSAFVFRGYKFNVSTVYKGDDPSQLIAGIDMADDGWVKEFQDEGGEFLLLLETSMEADFLVPVGGTNGMIQILQGKVHNQNEENTVYYDEFLKSQLPTSHNVEKSESVKNLKSYTPLVIIVVVIVGVVLFLITRYRKKK